MTELTLTTPSLLFSAISLILLAYTNRFLSYASVVRQLKDNYDSNPNNDPTTLAQIDNLVTRLKLIRAMQIFGASSLLFSTAAMFISVEALSLRLTTLKEAKSSKNEGKIKKIFKKKRRRKPKAKTDNKEKEA